MKRREASVSRHAKLARIFVIGAKHLAAFDGIKHVCRRKATPQTHHSSRITVLG